MIVCLMLLLYVNSYLLIKTLFVLMLGDVEPGTTMIDVMLVPIAACVCFLIFFYYTFKKYISVIKEIKKYH